jgi:hypothetical protein
MIKLLLTDTQKKKKLNGLCVTPFCMKKHRHGRSHCHSCIERQKQDSDPIKYVYETWQGNCKRRKKVNTVTLEEFKSFVEKYDYMRKRGRGAKKFTISRKKECEDGCPREWCQAHGYHYHNIESIMLKENLYKQRHNIKYAEVPF